MGIFYIVCEENEDRGLVWAGSQFISKDIGFVENVLKRIFFKDWSWWLLVRYIIVKLSSGDVPEDKIVSWSG